MLDPRTDDTNDHFHSFNPTGDSYDSWGALSFGMRARKTAQNYENYRHGNGGEVQFNPQKTEEDPSGACSPPLWKPRQGRGPAQPGQIPTNFRYLSPTSRTQAIARGQWELMEMIKNMPESCYELSLKDLVEQPRPYESQEDCLTAEKISEKENGGGKVMIRRQESKKTEKGPKLVTTASMDNKGGMLLKVVFPVSFGGSKRRKKKTKKAATSTKVSPRPENSDKSSKGNVEREWWKKRFSSSTESESGVSSNNNSGSNGSSGSSGSSGSRNSSRSNSGRKMSGFLPCCCFSLLNKTSQRTAK